jgi:hypothetical protein
VVPAALLDDPVIDEWIAKSFEYAATLPAKKPKASKKV